MTVVRHFLALEVLQYVCFPSMYLDYTLFYKWSFSLSIIILYLFLNAKGVALPESPGNVLNSLLM